MHRLPAFIIVLFFLVSSSAAGAFTAAATATPRYVEGELLVKYKDEQNINRLHSAAKSRVAKRFQRLHIDHVRLPAGLAVQDAIKEYQKDPNVEYAEPNYIARKSINNPNDPRYLTGDQWGLTNMSAPYAWSLATGGTVTVAVLDTGIYYLHEDLQQNLWVNPGEIAGNGIDDDGDGIIDDVYGANYNQERNPAVTGDPLDDDIADSHGTHVSGIIGGVGNNSLGVSGVNWNVKIMAVKFLHGSNGTGGIPDAIDGILYAVDHGAKVINCSFEIGGYSSSLESAFKYADDHGVLTVSAAGNAHKNNDISSISPASIRTPNNIAVAAVTSGDVLATYSDYGRVTVDLAAPGGDLPQYTTVGVLSTTYSCGASFDWYSMTCPTPIVMGYNYLSGTSMAAPFVAGLAALIWSQNPALTHYQVKGRILNGVDKLADLSNKTITGGRINAYNSLALQGSAELPAIFKVSPYALPPTGGQVTITGVNFGSSVGTAMLDPLPLVISSWTDTAIIATVPDAGSVSGAVQVNGLGSTFPLTIMTQPTVTLIAEPDTGSAPLDVIFTAQASDLDGYIVKYEWDNGLGSFVYDPRVASSALVTYYQPGTYTARVRVTDNSGLTAIGSVQVTVFNSTGGDRRCFIATAAYGSPLAPQVQALREFRDRRLLTTAWGRAFVSFYYRCSPPIAEYIGRHGLARAVVRWALAPVIIGIRYPSLAGAALFILLIAGRVMHLSLRK